MSIDNFRLRLHISARAGCKAGLDLCLAEIKHQNVSIITGEILVKTQLCSLLLDIQGGREVGRETFDRDWWRNN